VFFFFNFRPNRENPEFKLYVQNIPPRLNEVIVVTFLIFKEKIVI